MIVFLDRLNDPSDVPLIQLLGCRLLAGQNAAGGWTYQAWNGTGDDAGIRKRVGVKDPKLIRPEPRPDPNAPPPTPPKLHPDADKIYRAVRAGARTVPGLGTYAGDDNSNTQFAIVGLWVAQRRGVPCGAAFRAIDARYMRSQSPTDHGWSYNATAGHSTPSMTCAGLLGLAVAAAHEAGRLPGDRADAGAAPAQPNRPKDDDPFFNPPTGKGGGDPDAPPPEEEEQEEGRKKTNPFRDAAIKRGLEAIGRLLKGAGAGRGPAGGEAAVGPGGLGAAGWGGITDLYFFWSLERVAVAFGLDTIGEVDWYSWGAAQILKMQAADGSWAGNYQTEATTAFAILFLAKSNFVTDLSARIKGKVKDPGVAELKGERGGVLGLKASGSAEAVRTPGSTGPANAAPGQGPGDLAQVVGQTMADKVAAGLVKATDKQWPTRLQQAKDEKGGQYTAALVAAAAQLDGKRQYQVREALADRLTRMTADTLKRYLKDRDPELRRAACLACAMKDDKQHVSDVIDRVMDVDESVIRAAKAALKSLTGKDFGPQAGATDKQKEEAYIEWLRWYSLEGRGK
jgi:hypothetical protein